MADRSRTANMATTTAPRESAHTAPERTRFDGEAVLVTGVGRAGQVGEAVATELARLGAHVYVVSHSAEEARARADDIGERGHIATGFGCDLTDEHAVAELAADVTRATGGRLDALVNLAGGFAMSGPVGESDLAVLHRQIAINFVTAYLTTRALLPCVRAARGAVVYVASAAVLPGANAAGMSAYAAAKSGVVALMRAVADEERDHGVRANAIAPTAIRTAANLAAMGANTHYVERDDVASAVAFLCSRAAGGVTGQVLPLR
jgi:NAD(P)-dependent dehydrogenase (short-subunit alcohol dehydrogenase family)